MIWKVRYWHKSIPHISVFIWAADMDDLIEKCRQRGLLILKIWPR
jgi:hypothetical protein